MSAGHATSHPEFPPALADELRGAIDQWASAPGHYGVSASVVLDDGRDHPPVGGRGIVRLDDPIARWLEPRPWVDPVITVRQLLNHTAGLANYTANPGLGEAARSELMHVFTVEELLAFVGPPRFAPGAETEYTNTSFLLLGLIAERAPGRSIVDLFRQRLWSLLELTDIFLPGLEDPPGPIAPALPVSRWLRWSPPTSRATSPTAGWSSPPPMST